MIPFVGPSYTLEVGKASQARAVNLHLVAMETPSKAQYILRKVPGLEECSGSIDSPTRGCYATHDRAFVVGGAKLYELNSGGTLTERGTLSSYIGKVSMASGHTQLVIVDGTDGYVLTLATNTFAQITDPDWPGADQVEFLDGFFIFTRESSEQVYVSAIDDATSIDALDFASAESYADPVTAVAVRSREVILLGSSSTERFFNSGGDDYPFSRDNAALAEVGVQAPWSVAKLDNSLMWVGRDRNGDGMVLRDVDRIPRRISTSAVEEALRSSSDLAEATAYTYQEGAQAFYCINAPGLNSTWCYEVSTATWFEACDLDGLGQFEAFRLTHAMFAFGESWGFDMEGRCYRITRDAYTFAGDVIKCSRISPNDVTPTREEQFYAEFVLDCTTGESAQGDDPVVELSWSNNGGRVFGNPVSRPYGPVGEFHPRLVWYRLGRSRDRVWRVDFTGNAPFAIIHAAAA
jgi:hypothetical protein